MSAARALRTAEIGTADERSLARAIALGFLSRLPRIVPREDVLQAALVGLWDGVQRCASDVSPEQRKYYLITRIRGQILDELRAQDWLPRRTRKLMRQDPDAPRLNVARFDDIGRADEGHAFEELLPAPGPSPEELCIRESDVAEAMGAPLNARQRRVLRGHYFGGRRFIDLADEFGISEPRISQDHAKALDIVRAWQTGDCDGKSINREVRLAIERKHRERDDHRDLDRGAGSAADAPARAGAFPCAVPKRWLGGSAPAAAHRPGARRARGAELDGATRAEPGRAPTGAGPAPLDDRGRGGGLPVISAGSAAAVSEEPVPSVLPEEGVDLMVEVLRYEHWLIDQALLRAAGNKERAAQILRLKRTTLVEKLQRRAGKRGPYLALRVSDETIARAVAASGSASKAAEELGIGVATVYRRMAKQAPATPAPSEAPALEAVLVPFADRIPWAEVADMRARGLREYDITRTIASRLGTHRFTIEKALRQPRPLAKCGP